MSDFFLNNNGITSLRLVLIKISRHRQRTNQGAELDSNYARLVHLAFDNEHLAIVDTSGRCIVLIARLY
ncbi:hypothetical protein DPMN_084137 [Dreissena polymorpha]|uniref:Uncharacterized protein n=1 Tax=Dreissena polymorpha TaxID=45954 RepID=A0A9D3YCK9_DREPO|nr:hypothetical protein DPMN_084137 [Dreissena polymorpha]